MTLQNGVLTEVKADKPSELAAVAQALVDVVKLPFRVIGEVLKLRLDYSTAAANLTDQQKKEAESAAALQAALQAIAQRSQQPGATQQESFTPGGRAPLRGGSLGGTGPRRLPDISAQQPARGGPVVPTPGDPGPAPINPGSSGTMPSSPGERVAWNSSWIAKHFEAISMAYRRCRRGVDDKTSQLMSKTADTDTI